MSRREGSGGIRSLDGLVSRKVLLGGMGFGAELPVQLCCYSIEAPRPGFVLTGTVP